MIHQKSDGTVSAHADSLSEDELSRVQGGAAPQLTMRPQHDFTVTAGRGPDALELFRERLPVINPQRIREQLAEIHPDLEDPFPKGPKEPSEPPIPPDLEDPFPPRPPTDVRLIHR
jgi:hypothetical protein